jgi:hypothetical protein
LFRALLAFNHEATDDFIPLYLAYLGDELDSPSLMLSAEERQKLRRFREFLERFVQYREFPQELISQVSWAESKIGKATTQKLRETTWLKVLSEKNIILIDTPDYSKTDKRRMDGDLQEIYWFWTNMLTFGSSASIVVAIQKEMFHDHFFLDKMHRFDLKPLPPERMVESYRLKFGSTYPFSEEALLTVARLSRGIFRRFLRYILMTLDLWSKRQERPHIINEGTVREAVPLERLAEDMELELLGLFPKHSELRILAVRLLMILQERGPQKQSQLANELDIEPFAISRLLGKLESAKHVTRSRDGTDKVVSLGATEEGT